MWFGGGGGVGGVFVWGGGGWVVGGGGGRGGGGGGGRRTRGRSNRGMGWNNWRDELIVPFRLWVLLILD